MVLLVFFSLFLEMLGRLDVEFLELKFLSTERRRCKN